MNKAPERSVVIGFPCYDGRNAVQFTHCYGETVRLGCQLGIPVVMGCRAYDATLPRARNDVLRDFVESGATDLMLIDCDEEWRPEWVFQLLTHEVDVVGAPVVNKSDQVGFNVRSSKVPIPRDLKTGLLMPDGGCGTGFLRLSKEAVVAVREVSETYRDATKIENKWVFENRIVDGELFTEDYVLMEKLKELGYILYLDDNMTCSHVGTKKWNGDFASWHDSLEEKKKAPPAKKAAPLVLPKSRIN